MKTNTLAERQKLEDTINGMLKAFETEHNVRCGIKGAARQIEVRLWDDATNTIYGSGAGGLK